MKLKEQNLETILKKVKKNGRASEEDNLPSEMYKYT